jgi:DNA-binding MarR family transcriptional regulator
MGRALEVRLASRKFEGPHQEAMLNIIVASSHVRGLLDEVFAGEGLTPAQYNALRILNGAYPEGYPRGEIARRMLDRAPDLTRLLDRLARRGLVNRSRTGEDGRQSIARITPKGRQMLAGMHGLVRAVVKHLEQRLSEREAKTLSRLCEKVYGQLD